MAYRLSDLEDRFCPAGIGSGLSSQLAGRFNDCEQTEQVQDRARREYSMFLAAASAALLNRNGNDDIPPEMTVEQAQAIFQEMAADPRFRDMRVRDYIAAHRDDLNLPEGFSPEIFGNMTFGEYQRGMDNGQFLVPAQGSERLADVAARWVNRDGIGEGYCARAVKGFLNRAYGIDMRGDGVHATGMDESLLATGQFQVVGRFGSAAEYEAAVRAGLIAEGAIAVVQSDAESGQRASFNGRGAQYGHISVLDVRARGEDGRPTDFRFVADDDYRSSAYSGTRDNDIVVFQYRGQQPTQVAAAFPAPGGMG